MPLKESNEEEVNELIVTLLTLLTRFITASSEESEFTFKLKLINLELDSVKARMKLLLQKADSSLFELSNIADMRAEYDALDSRLAKLTDLIRAEGEAFARSRNPGMPITNIKSTSALVFKF